MLIPLHPFHPRLATSPTPSNMSYYYAPPHAYAYYYSPEPVPPVPPPRGYPPNLAPTSYAYPMVPPPPPHAFQVLGIDPVRFREAQTLVEQLGYSSRPRPYLRLLQILRITKERYEQGLLPEDQASRIESEAIYAQIAHAVGGDGPSRSNPLRAARSPLALPPMGPMPRNAALAPGTTPPILRDTGHRLYGAPPSISRPAPRPALSRESDATCEGPRPTPETTCAPFSHRDMAHQMPQTRSHVSPVTPSHTAPPRTRIQPAGPRLLPTATTSSPSPQMHRSVAQGTMQAYRVTHRPVLRPAVSGEVVTRAATRPAASRDPLATHPRGATHRDFSQSCHNSLEGQRNCRRPSGSGAQLANMPMAAPRRVHFQGTQNSREGQLTIIGPVSHALASTSVACTPRATPSEVVRASRNPQETRDDRRNCTRASGTLRNGPGTRRTPSAPHSDSRRGLRSLMSASTTPPTVSNPSSHGMTISHPLSRAATVTTALWQSPIASERSRLTIWPVLRPEIAASARVHLPPLSGAFAMVPPPLSPFQLATGYAQVYPIGWAPSQMIQTMYGGDEDRFRPAERPPNPFPVATWGDFGSAGYDELEDDYDDPGGGPGESRDADADEDEMDAYDDASIHDDEERSASEDELRDDRDDELTQDEDHGGCRCYWDGSQEVCECTSERSKSPSTSE